MKKTIIEDSGWTLEGPNKPHTLYYSDISNENYCAVIEPAYCTFCGEHRTCITCDMGMDGFAICLPCLLLAVRDIGEYTQRVVAPKVLKR